MSNLRVTLRGVTGESPQDVSKGLLFGLHEAHEILPLAICLGLDFERVKVGGGYCLKLDGPVTKLAEFADQLDRAAWHRWRWFSRLT